MALVWLSFLVLVPRTLSQSIQNLGSSGGHGPRGGIGDATDPVLEAQAWVTDAMYPLAPNTTRQLAKGPAPVRAQGGNPLVCPPPRPVIIDSSARGARQQMVGFGHAWTDSTVSTFNSLDLDVLDQVMNDLFGQQGNNMGFMRHTIGSSDLSGNAYSYDDNGPSFNEGEPDLEVENFDLGLHGTAMAEMLALMGKYKSDVFLYGSPWSYPGWTKYNGLFIAPNLNSDGTYNILNNSFDTRYIPQMVKYFTKYIDTYRKDFGVYINGMTLMNEPLNYQGGYPCMFLDAADEAAILAQGLGAALNERGVIAMAYDHNTDQPVYPLRVVTGAPDLVQAAAWHCYQSPVANYSVLEDLHYAFPSLLQFMTECTTYLPQAGSLNFGVAMNFIEPVRHGASGASMWVMATDPDYGPHSPYGGCAGCLGSIIVNSSTTYTKTNDYYVIGQFSRFVRRGAINHNVVEGIVGNAATDRQLLIMAVNNPDKSWAIVFMNNLNSTQNIRLSFTEGGDLWEGTIDNATITTWLIPSDEVLAQEPPPASPSRPPHPQWNSSWRHDGPGRSWVWPGPGTRPLPGPHHSWQHTPSNSRQNLWSSGWGHTHPTSPGTSMSDTICAATTTHAPETSSSSTSSTTPLIPVPNTTHVVTANIV